jgi:EAL domain-containing protein (putative c-di-GMP-specific phosphodiesterase class I)
MDFKMAINVSPVQLFNPNFISFVQRTLSKHDISPAQVQIEITESMLISNVDFAIFILNKIRELGISIAMDDFGTGFSSLSYLQSLPLDTLKIDRCFVDQMIFSEKSRRLVQAIIALAHTFDLTVVAEGIETKEQYRMLVNMGCEEGQGYLIDAPLLPNEFPPQPLVVGVKKQYSFV